MLDLLRGSVRPMLAYLFGGVFAALVILGFIFFGTAEMANKLLDGFVPVVAMIAALYFQSRSNNSGGQ
jgi:hypothetical protein